MSDITTITLVKKGQVEELEDNKVRVQLYWETKVDLDLHAWYISHGHIEPKRLKNGFGLFGRKYKYPTHGHIFFQNRGSRSKFPYISLDKDSGVGGALTDGNKNEENMVVHNVVAHESILVAANIYGRSQNFKQFNSKITIFLPQKEIIIPLDDNTNGPWNTCCVIHNTDNTKYVIRVDETIGHMPNPHDVISKAVKMIPE